MDNLTPQALKDYLLNISDEEPPLLAKLREDTTKLIGLGQMLTGPIEAKFLQLLIKLKRAKNCLEIGTFTGYSALYMSAGLPIDGTLITCEINETHAQFAQRYFNQSPDGHKIKLRLGSALDTLERLTEPFDFIFLDADQKNYPLYYEKLISLLAKDSVLIVDNALWKMKVLQSEQDKTTQAIHQFNLLAKQDKRVETLILPIRDGLLMIRKL